jgi:MOSC domain-containing protein YiiM
LDDAGTIEAIWLKRAHRGPMDLVLEATLIAGQGLAGSVGRSRRRQVTLLAREAWERCEEEVGAKADPARRRANILVSGLSLAHTRGRVLAIGSARIVVDGEVTPCERMEEVLPGLQSAMRAEWRGGVFAQVDVGGVIRVGDRIAWVREAAKDIDVLAAPTHG